MINKKKVLSKNSELKKSFLLSYIWFFVLIIVSVLVISIVSIISSKNALTDLGDTALRNRVQMGLAMMDGLQQQVEKGSITKDEAQEMFRSLMLNPKQSDGKTRGENDKLELGIKAYMFAIDSKGIEMMHPYKEGEDISALKDTDGNSITKLIMDEASNPKNNGIIHFMWRNSDNETEKPKVSAVGYFEPWDWYISVGCYNEDFYKSSYSILIIIICFSLLIIIVSILLIRSLMKKKVHPLSDIVNAMEKVSEGNLKAFVDVKSRDEIGYIGGIFNKMLDQISSILLSIKKVSEVLNEKSNSINSSTETTLTHSNNIQDAMEEISSSMSNSTSELEGAFESIKVLSNDIDSIKRSSIDMKRESEEAYSLNANIIDILSHLEKNNSESIIVTRETNDNINNLTEKSNVIVGIVSTIEQISNQINLLALNASIESARAGEAGKGFAVVADQIKKLSSETSTAVKQINQLINELMNVINQSVSSVSKSELAASEQIKTINETRVILEKVIAFTEKIPKIVDANVSKIEDAYKNNDIVSSSMDSILSVSQEITASSEEVTAHSSEVRSEMKYVNKLTEELNNSVAELNSKLSHFSI